MVSAGCKNNKFLQVAANILRVLSFIVTWYFSLLGTGGVILERVLCKAGLLKFKCLSSRDLNIFNTLVRLFCSLYLDMHVPAHSSRIVSFSSSVIDVYTRFRLENYSELLAVIFPVPPSLGGL